jgi:hypothetical protein
MVRSYAGRGACKAFKRSWLLMSDNESCPGSHTNPRSKYGCRCNSMSEQPCSYCDWWEYHQHCEPLEEEKEYEEEPGDFYEHQTSWDNKD